MIKKLSLNREDATEIEKRGISQEEVERQLLVFKRGNIVVDIVEAATVKNGIERLSDDEIQQYIDVYTQPKESLEVLKFVPASGAATRMFKAFYQFIEEFDPEQENLEDFLDRRENSVLERFFGRMKDLPFYQLVWQKMRENHQYIDSLQEEQQQLIFVKTMLLQDGLGYGGMAKGLVPFHKYQEHLLTAFEEHLVEAAEYASFNGVAKLHFTVAPDQRQGFENQYNRIKTSLEKELSVRFEVYFSYQDSSTDTIAVSPSNEPFRDDDGKAFFRPGGHGALIGNLAKQQADLVFIKNIDNVVVPRHREVLIRYKKALAGKLLSLQEEAFTYLKKLDTDEVSDQELNHMVEFLQKDLKSGLNINFEELSITEKKQTLIRKMNRPMRVCGIVANEGEPGGGPFWVRNQSGDISLQIVESAQIDHDNYQQSKIAQEATHFNPVDLVCGLKDFRGQVFNLPDYVDHDTSFITSKTKDGKELKALERPGLWNGAMADWISIFIEVPLETFNPVKTVADLLKPSHQVR